MGAAPRTRCARVHLSRRSRGTPRSYTRGVHSSPAPSRRARLIVGALASCSFAASFVIAGWLFPHLSANNDEAVYVFQAKTIESGSLTLPAEPHADFFRPWMSGPRDDRQVLVFQPVFPATLALSDLLFGTMRVAPAAITAGCVLLIFAFAHAALRDERVALLAAALMALSPLTLVHSGMYLEYLYAVLLELAVLVLVLRAEGGHTRLRLVAAGLIHGVLFFMRPFDAILLGIVVIAMQLVARPATLRAASRVIATVGAAAVPGVLACLAYNRHVTGHYLRFPLWAIGGDNNLGFGTRSIASGAPVIDFRFTDAWIAIRQNVRSFPHWLAGGVVAVPVGAFGLWRLRRERVFGALVTIALVFPVGYLAYWGNILIVFGRRAIGPHYYLALLIPGCIAVAAGLDGLVRRGRAVLGVTVAALLVATAIELPDKIDRNRDDGLRAAAEDHAIRAAVVDDAVVVLPITLDGPYVLHPRGWLMNEPDLQGHILFAADRGGENNALFDRYPNRAIWRFQSARTADGATRPDMQSLRRIALDSPRTLPVTLRNTTAERVVVVQVAAGSTKASCVLDRTSSRDAVYQVRATIDASQVTVACPDRDITTALGDGDGTLTIGAAFGPNEDTGFSRINEYRVWYRRGGATTTAISPAEQWSRDPAPAPRWRVTVDDPAIALSLG